MHGGARWAEAPWSVWAVFGTLAIELRDDGRVVLYLAGNMAANHRNSERRKGRRVPPRKAALLSGG